jgi:RNA polymerase-binding transcription factor DksA
MITPHSSTETATGAGTPDPRWAWHLKTLLRLRDALLRAHAEHEASAADRAELHSVDAADVAEDRIEHQVILAELHAEEDRLAEIEAALTRIRNGAYGICEATGEPIASARLKAIPWTRFSLGAAERAELKILPPSKRPRRRSPAN